MKLLLDSFWRAGAYLFLPRVIGLSLLPLLLACVLAVGLGWFFWTDAIDAVRRTLESWSLVEAALRWVDAHLGVGLRALLGPIIVVALAAPLLIILSLLLVAWLMTPAIVTLVRERRFATLEARHGAPMWRAVLWSIGCTVLALLALLVSLPLWLIPPLVMILPPLIWGWLTKQVMSYDVLADMASETERRAVVSEHRWPLLIIGIVTGYLGAAPSLIWAVSSTLLIFAPLLIALSVWLYTLVFVFSALWFAHYALAALAQWRQAHVVDVVAIPEAPPLSPTDRPALPPGAPTEMAP